MAEIKSRVDDMDGTDNRDRPVRTHTFSLDGVVKEIDLHDDNWERMQRDFSRYIDVAREISRSAPARTLKSVTPAPTRARTTVSRKVAHNDPAQLQAEREWLWTHGHSEVSKFGKIPEGAHQAYLRHLEDMSQTAHRHKNGHGTHNPGSAELFSAATG